LKTIICGTFGIDYKYKIHMAGFNEIAFTNWIEYITKNSLLLGLVSSLKKPQKSESYFNKLKCIDITCSTYSLITFKHFLKYRISAVYKAHKLLITVFTDW